MKCQTMKYISNMHKHLNEDRIPKIPTSYYEIPGEPGM
jgi:hypothetical protein